VIETEQSLGRLLEEAAELAEREGTWALVGFSEDVGDVDPLAAFAAAGMLRTFWRPPDTPAMVTSGTWMYGWSDTLPSTLRDHPQVGSPPVLTAAIPFDLRRVGGPWHGFQFGLRLPRHVLHGRMLTSYAIVSSRRDLDALADGIMRYRRHLLSGWAAHNRNRGPTGSPRWQTFEPAVRACLAAMPERGLRKVVPARAVEIPGRWDEETVLRRLDAAQPHCTVFADQRGTDHYFLGATPEWLARVHQGHAHVSCLAGTAPRGVTPEEDHALGAALLADPKNRVEHALVLEMIREALHDLPVLEAESPQLMRLPHLQHLSTPLQVRDANILDLALRLHPTPAVAGLPVRDAMDLLREVESFDRGGYAGLVGWVDLAGNGELAVALRSALLHDGCATLYAGCGVVPGSLPADEARESRLKLRPVLDALGVEGRE